MEEKEIVNEEKKPNERKFLKNFFLVLVCNVVSVIAGVFVGFVIPKIMGVTEYGYYKTFTLYSSYIGILHFGFIDGIYLKFAGKEYDELDKLKFRTYTRFLFMMEALATLVVIAISFFLFSTSYFLVIMFVGINILATNVITYFEFITQITMLFKRTTIRNIIRCLFNIVAVTILFLLYKYNSVVIYNYYYVIITLGVNYALALWYIMSYRDIVFGKSYKFKEIKDELFYFFKVGIPLLLSNLVVQMIFIVDQQFVNIAFDIDTYSRYAFAYNMINLITVATTALSTVLYPTLNRMKEETITNNYSKINSYLLIFVAFCLIAYYPLVLIVNHFLTDYVESLNTFVIILPGVMISSSISVVKYNCYKTFGKVNNYFLKSISVLALAVLADLIVYLIFKNTASISIVSIIVLLVWYMLAELYFIRKYKVHWIKNICYLLLILGGFYGASFIPNIFLAGGAYIIYYIVITLILFYQEIDNAIKSLKNKKQRKEDIQEAN